MFPDGRLDVKNAALYVGLSENTLANMRSKGIGPQFLKKGRIFYFLEDLNAWLFEAGKCSSTTQYSSLCKLSKPFLEQETC